jgi:hypothetical protein
MLSYRRDQNKDFLCALGDLWANLTASFAPTRGIEGLENRGDSKHKMMRTVPFLPTPTVSLRKDDNINRG